MTIVMNDSLCTLDTFILQKLTIFVTIIQLTIIFRKQILGSKYLVTALCHLSVKITDAKYIQKRLLEILYKFHIHILQLHFSFKHLLINKENSLYFQWEWILTLPGDTISMLYGSLVEDRFERIVLHIRGIQLQALNQKSGTYIILY